VSAAEPLPLLDLRIDPDAITAGYPFDVPAIRALVEMRFDTPITLFVGENGTGKSTLLEAVAIAADLPSAGGAELARDASLDPVRPLATALRLGWSARLRQGCFFRAEDFLGFVRRIEATRAELRSAADRVAIDKAAEGDGEVRRAQAPYTGQIAALTAHHGEDAEGRSHGESFLAFFRSRLRRRGLFVLDEAEAALSPLRQLAFLALLREAERAGAQVLMATHAPIVLAYPGATIVSFDGGRIARVRFDDLEHVRLTRAVLADPDAFTRRL
jgi:predicted ATPase